MVPREPEKETGRVEAFSDGVFAIAITLLIIEVKVPRDGPGTLERRLLEQWPAYAAFLNSFLTIGIMWINHHRIFTHVKRVDHTLMVHNGLLLLFVTVVPFPTAVLAEHFNGEGSRLAATIYSMNGMMIAICFNVLWRHGRRFVAADADRGTMRRITIEYRVAPLLYLACALAARWSVPASVAMNTALAVAFALPLGSRRTSRM